MSNLAPPDPEKLKSLYEIVATQWRPIETAPKNGDDILVAMWGNTALVVSWDNENPEYPWITLDGPSYAKEAPTHWMPIPTLPEKD